MSIVSSYLAEDPLGNKYLCNHEYNAKTDEHSIKLGATFRTACVVVEYDAASKCFWLLDAFYNAQCAYNGLKPSAGTKSMIFTALCITKALYPHVKTFMLQDNSQVDRQSAQFHLYEYYLLTRGITWYQTFLPLDSDDNVKKLIGFLSKTVTQTPLEIAVAYGINPNVIENIYNKCARNGSFNWFTFHSMLFNEHVQLRNNDVFRKIIVYHTSETFVAKLFGAKYTGSFDDIDCDGMIGTTPIETRRFAQAGGSIYPQVNKNNMVFTLADIE